MNWNQNKFNYSNYLVNQPRYYPSPAFGYFSREHIDPPHIIHPNDPFFNQKMIHFEPAPSRQVFNLFTMKTAIKSLFIRNFSDSKIFILPHQAETPCDKFKSRGSSECSLAAHLKPAESDSRKCEPSTALLESHAQLNNLQLEIDGLLKEAFDLKTSPKLKCSAAQSNQMILEYEAFHKRNVCNFRNLVKEFGFSRESNGFSQLILKFLLDILHRDDLARMTAKESYLLQNFFVNRFFRGIKSHILANIEKSAIFKQFGSEWNFTPKNPCMRINSPVSILEQMSYSHSINLWYSTGCSLDKTRIFDERFLRSFAQAGPEDLRNLYKAACVRLHRLTFFLIFKTIVMRFNKTQVVYDEIESLEREVCGVVEHVLATLLELQKTGPNFTPEKRKLVCSRVFAQLNAKFRCGQVDDFRSMVQYIKFREMREYLQRKRKSKFVRPRRNDEKLKKIYKNLLKTMLERYKYSEMKGLATTTPNTQPSSENSSVQVADPGRMVWSKAENELIRSGPSGLDIFAEKKVQLRSEQLKMNFYEFYFKDTSREIAVPFEYFFDPLKKIYKNPGFKSFTVKYFKMLLRSQKFKCEIEALFGDFQFLLEALLDYPKMFRKMLESVPTILIDQQKKKSKFLWTSYEFFFASYFFKKKVSI